MIICLLYFDPKRFSPSWNFTGTAVLAQGIKFYLLLWFSFLDNPTSKLQDILHPSPFIDSIYFVNYIEVKNYSVNTLEDYLKTKEVIKIRLSGGVLDVEIIEIDKNVIKYIKNKRDSSKNKNIYELF